MGWRLAWWRVALLALVALLPVLGVRAVPARTSAAQIASPASTAPGLSSPDTPLARQLSWVLAQVNGGASSLNADTIAQHFTDDFLASLPADQLIATFQQFATQLAPARIGRFEGAATGNAASVLLLVAGPDQWRVTISVAPTPPYRIDGLFFAPAPAPAVPEGGPISWAAFDKQFAALAPESNVLAAELTGGTCRPINAMSANRPRAIASAFKLYVLGELAHQVETGKASWNEQLAIHDAWKSLPAGDMRLEAAGTEHSLQDYAAQMISVSDNTTADHLLHRLGREQVEAFQAHMGQSEPALNEPFLFTREWFALKSALPDAAVNAYVAAPTATKRTLLAQEVDPTSISEEDDLWTEPLRISTIEWFASASDLCRAMATLQTMAQHPGLAPITDILSINPDLPFDAHVWSYVGFKGGDETGVMSRTWLLRRADGRWFVLTACLNNPEHPIDAGTATRLLISAVALLGATK